MPQSSENLQTGFAALVVLAVIAVLIVGGFGMFKLSGGEIEFPGKQPTITPIITPVITPKVCTMDVKICPDGSAVSRVAPDCNFAPCSLVPTSTLPSAITDNDLEGDLKALENAGTAIDSGIGNISQSLNDKPDNLVE